MVVGSTYVEHHLWFVCTLPDRNGHVVVANAATLHPDSPDLTCVLHPGDHPWINRDSWIVYYLADFRSENSLLDRIAKGTLKPERPAMDELMLRIREGARNSRHTPNDVRIAVIRCPWKPA